jgi:molybdate transport system ATP-binding protein
MMETLRTFQGEVLLVTHDRGEAYRLSGHACVMDLGQNEALVPTERLFSAPRTKTAALLSGCKNIAAIERLGAHTLRVPAWGGQAFHTSAEIPAGAEYLGIRANHLRFGGPEEENAMPVRVESITPDLFSTAYTLLAGSGLIRLEGGKAMPGAPGLHEQACVILPADAMMLLEA